MRAPALVVLAGGAGERLGECKALVDLAGRTPLERLLAGGACFDGAPPLVVAGAHAPAIAARAPSGVEVADNDRWRDGRGTSIALALARRAGLDLCFAPVDVPLVPRTVFEALLREWRDAGLPPGGWLAPHVRGDATRFGHPVVVGRALLERFDEREPLRALRTSARPLLAVPVESERILDDLDTPEDLERLRRVAAADRDR